MGSNDGAVPDEAPDQVPGGDVRRRRLVELLDIAGTDLGAAVGAQDGTSHRDPAGGSASARSGLPGLRGRLERLCAITAVRAGVDGAGVTVMGSADAGPVGHRDQLAAAGPLTRRLEDLQFTTGEGPCLDAYSAGAPVLVGDLSTETARWLGFGPEAAAAGAAAVFSLPLQVGTVRLGTLDLHRSTTGALTREQLADALTLAGLATEMLLELADAPEPQDLADHLDPDPDGDPGPWPDAGWLPDVHADVHVASGMVSAQQGIDVGVALLRIRAYAFARREPIGDVARRIIGRTLTLDHPGNDSPHGAPEDPLDDPGPLGPDPENQD